MITTRIGNAENPEAALTLNGELRRSFAEALARAFTLQTLEMMLAHRLEKDLADFDGANLTAKAFSVVATAEREGWTAALLEAARADNPGNPQLIALEGLARVATPGPQRPEGATGHKPSNLPFPSLGDLFKGREPFLETLHIALQETGKQGAAVAGRALHGLGGVGKTRLAVEYAHRRQADYCALLFVSAETPERLHAGLAALVGPDVLNLPEQDARKDAAKIAAVLGWLDGHPGWLLILDNIDDEAALRAVKPLFARLKGGRIVITGRLSNYFPEVRKLELGVLDTDAATDFLLRRTDGDRARAGDDAVRARVLAAELGGLALGLEQAGAYIATERIGFARYLKLWEENRENVLGWFNEDLMSYQHDTGLAATWATSVEKLTPEARRLLERLAFLAPEAIPDTLLEVPIPGEADGHDAHTARGKLFAYSLATRIDGAHAPSFSVHRLVQDYARRSMDDARRTEALAETLHWLGHPFVNGPLDVRAWPVLDPLMPHALAVIDHADRPDAGGGVGTLMNQIGVILRAKARNAEAEPLFRRALAIDEVRYGPQHQSVAIRLNNLAQLLGDTNRFVEAEALFRRALAINEATHGPDHSDIATVLNNLAVLLRQANRRVEAEPLLWRALAIDEAALGAGHPNVATRLVNLAWMLRESNRGTEAEPLLRRALAIDEAYYGAEHPEVAADLNNLAELLRKTGRRDEAEPLFRRALAIDETSFGPEHPTVAIRLSNLAQLLYDTDRLAEAEPLMRRALAITEANDGPNHPNVATRLNNLAVLLRASGRSIEAEPPFRRALAIDEASYGPQHPEVAADLNNLAELLSDSKRRDEAEPLYRRALAIMEASRGPEHATTATVRRNLQILLGEM